MTRRLALLATGALLHGGALASIGDPIAVPASLQAYADEEPLFALTVDGVQRYECRALATMTDRYAWAWLGPDAALRDAQGRPAGRLVPGPQWVGRDGGRMVGRVRASAAAPGPDDLPWEVIAREGPATGAFTQVTSVQQVETRGGLPPTTACDESVLGRQAQSPFQARQVLYRKKSPA